MKKVLITGATGLIGRKIVEICHDKDWIVHYLTTSKSKIKTDGNYKGFYWNPSENEIDHSCLEGVDTIINLVGATISERWTETYKKTILTSRTETAQLLYAVIKGYNYPVEHIVHVIWYLYLYKGTDDKF